MKTSLNKIAGFLAFIIGAMAVFAGGQVLLGRIPDYYVIDWLPLYNYTVGVITVIATATLIWTNNRLSRFAAVATFAAHTLVMLVLQTAYREVVATDSIRAMTIRMTVWIVVLTLMFFQGRKNKITNA